MPFIPPTPISSQIQAQVKRKLDFSLIYFASPMLINIYNIYTTAAEVV